MKIAVLVKEVPDLEARVRVVEGGKALDVEKKRVLNFFDEIAVEAAVRIKETASAAAYAVSAGHGSGIEAVRRALAMGVDAAFLADDPALAEAQPLTVARALAAIVQREGFDVVLAGRQATDDESGLVGPMVAELLGIPCVVGATKLDIVGGEARVGREPNGGTEMVKVPLPVLITAEKGLYEPRVPQVMGLMKAMRAQVPKVSLADLGVEPLPTVQVVEYRSPQARPPVRMIEGEPAEAAAELVRLLGEASGIL